MAKINIKNAILEDNLNGIPFTTPDVVVVPDKWVDGVHTRSMMRKNEFPIRAQIISTGEILEVFGFYHGTMVYTSSLAGITELPMNSNGMYNGVMGKDFTWLDKKETKNFIKIK
jgi:hypothetical protein